MKTNEIGNFFYEIGHHLYVNGGDSIVMKEVFIKKIEILKETPKKYKIKFSTLSTLNKGFNIQTKEKLYNKDSVEIKGKETTQDLFNKLDKYKETIKSSDRISEYKKRNILEEFEKLTKNKIKKEFNL